MQSIVVEPIDQKDNSKSLNLSEKLVWQQYNHGIQVSFKAADGSQVFDGERERERERERFTISQRCQSSLHLSSTPSNNHFSD